MTTEEMKLFEERNKLDDLVYQTSLKVNAAFELFSIYLDYKGRNENTKAMNERLEALETSIMLTLRDAKLELDMHVDPESFLVIAYFENKEKGVCYE